jgi:hypothetical protein
VSRLRGSPAVPLAWAALLAVQAALQFAFPTRLISHLLNAGMVATMVLLGLALLAPRRDRDEVGTTRALPDGSAATLLLALGLSGLVLGATLGTWMLLIGGGLALAGLAGLARERRASR